MTFLLLSVANSATAQKVVSPPQAAAPSSPSQPPSPGAGVPSGTPQTESSDQQKKSADEQRGTEQLPLIVKLQSTEKSDQEAAQAEREKQNQAAAKRWTEIVAWIVAVATAGQAVALIVTIAVMIRTARRQLRAYVFIDSTLINGMNAGQTPQVELVIKNFGQTPAYKVTHWIGVGIDSYPHPVETNTGVHLGPISLGPNGVIIIKQAAGVALTEAQITDILAGTVAIYAVGEIRYVDAFRKKRLTKFRLFSGATIGRPGEMATHQSGNDAN
jgi:hypothetical protein